MKKTHFTPTLKFLLSAVLCSALVSCSQNTPDVQVIPENQENQDTQDTQDTQENPDISANQTPPQTANSEEPPFVRGEISLHLALLSAPTGMGAVQLIEDNLQETTRNPYNITLLSQQSSVIELLLKGTVDMATLSPSDAATLYHQSNDLTVLAVNSLGGFLLLEKSTQTIQRIEDLSGKTIWLWEENKLSGTLLEKLLTTVGFTPEDVDIQWLSHQEIAENLRTEESGFALLPVLEASLLLSQNESLTQRFALGEEWTRLLGSSLPTGCVVVRNDFLASYPQLVDDFLLDYQKSISTLKEKDNQDETAQFLVNSGISSSYEVAQTALPNADLVFITGDDMKSLLQNFYLLLFQTDPDALGGGLPYDDFYYGAS